MKEKIKKILITFAEIGTVIWSVWGMWQVITFRFLKHLSEAKLKVFATMSEKGVNILLTQLLFCFFSAVLILYLLRKYGRKN